MTSSVETKAVAALYAKYVKGLPELHAKVESFVLHFKIADVVQRIQVATDPSLLCREFLRTYSDSEIICAAALKRWDACLTEQNNNKTRARARDNDDESVEDEELASDEDEREHITNALTQEETELVLETMIHHGQSKSVQLLGCALLSKFCHRPTVDSSQGAQVMMNAVSQFPEDEQVQETIWFDFTSNWHEDYSATRSSAFFNFLAAHNALPLGYAAMDRYTQNFRICSGVLVVMLTLISHGRGEHFERLIAAFAREHPNLDALCDRARETQNFSTINMLMNMVSQGLRQSLGT